MFIKIYARNNSDFLSIIHDKLQSIKGIASTETLMSLGETFKRQITVEGVADKE